MHFEILGFPKGVAYYYRDIFARFKIMRGKQNLASALGIQKENSGGNHAFFRDDKASIWKKKILTARLYMINVSRLNFHDFKLTLLLISE